MTQGAQDQLMTVADVIAAMGISRSTWQKFVTEKRTPPIVRIGAVQRIRQWIEARAEINELVREAREIERMLCGDLSRLVDRIDKRC